MLEEKKVGVGEGEAKKEIQLDRQGGTERPFLDDATLLRGVGRLCIQD